MNCVRVIHLAAALICGQLVQGERNCEWGKDEHVRRFVRVPEDASVGAIAFQVHVSRPDLLLLQPVTEEAQDLLTTAALGDGLGSVLVAAPLSRLVSEGDTTTSPVLKLALFCGNNPVSQQVTVYIDDVNNHSPVFLDQNITVTVDELTPTGLVILSEIRVRDGDKPNTANSEVELVLEEQRAFVPDPGDFPSGEHPAKGTRTSTRTSSFGGREGKARKFVRERDYFAMSDSKKGQIKLVRPLDFDKGPRLFQLKIVAKDMGKPSLSSSTLISVEVKDSDDLNPRFTSRRYKAALFEQPGPDVGASIREEVRTEPGPIHAFDGDFGINTPIKYSLIKGDSSSYFFIDEDTGNLFLVKHLDREKLPESDLTLHVLASQADNPSREASAEVVIAVKDVNDHLPVFENDVYSISIVENLPVGFSVVQVSAFDPDVDENGEFIYFINKNNTPLTVNPETGWLTVANQTMLDREVSTLFSLQVCTRQITPLSFLSREILVGQSNISPDQPTRKIDGVSRTAQSRVIYTRNILNATTPERPPLQSPEQTTPAMISVQSISPIVRSLPPSALLRERLQRERIQPSLKGGGPLPGKGSIESPFLYRKENSFGRLLASRRLLSQEKALNHTGENSTAIDTPHKIVVREARLDNERRKGSRLIPIEVMRKNISIESPCASIKLTLLDANDNNPVFVPSNHYSFVIMSDIKVGEIVGTVKAIDSDNGENGVVRYQLQQQNQDDATDESPASKFSLDERTGVLRVKSPVSPGSVTLFIEGSDSPTSPSETRTSLAIVSLNIKSYNNYEPQFLGAPYEFWVGADAPIGTSVGQVRVTDVGDKEVLFDMFHSYTETVPFGIEETSGIVAVTKTLQDFTRSQYDLEAVVTSTEETKEHFELSTNVTIRVAPPPRTGIPRDITIRMSVSENLSGGKVGDIIESLRNLGVRVPRDPRLQLVSPDTRAFFTLDENGILYTVTPLDYEQKPTHTLVVVSARTSLIFYVLVEVKDLNDNPPQFNAVRYEGSIKENSLRGTTVRITPGIKVTDQDSYEGASWRVQLVEEATSLFGFRRKSNQVVFIGKKLDREELRTHTLILKAVDDGNLTSYANLTITVLDVNDNPPEFIQRLDLFEGKHYPDDATSRKLDMPVHIWNLTQKKESILSVPESLPIGSKVSQVVAHDKDSSSFGKIEYHIELQTKFYLPPNDTAQKARDFSIEHNTGSILVSKKLQPNIFYLLNITATDGGGLNSMISVPIYVFDVNDHSPKFKEPSYSFKLLEGDYVVSEVGEVFAEDEDSGENGRVSYHIMLPANVSVADIPFRIVKTTGKILVAGTVDREMREKYELLVKAEDGGSPSMSATTRIQILIGDVNDHPPEFVDYQEMTSIDGEAVSNTPHYRTSVIENAPPGSIITKVNAEDLDKSSTGNGLLLYKFLESSPSLAIDSQDGTIYTIGRLDYETEPVLQGKIVVQDLGDTPLSSTSLLTVFVEDVENELVVRTFPQELYEVHAFENSLVPERLARIQLDPRATREKSFHLRLVDSSMLSTIHLDPLSGDLLLVRPLDREKKSNYRFKIRAVEVRKGRALEENSYYKPKRRRQNISDDITSFLLLPASTLERLDLKQQETTALSTEENTVTDVSQDEKPEKNQDGTFAEDSERVTEVEELALDEAWVHLIVNDVNDNAPVFLPSSSPTVAAVSSKAMFGDIVTKIKATDEDEGINSDIRYDILPTTISSQSISYFALDTATGELRIAGELKDIEGEMVSFDVKATDRRGDELGKSSITSAFIHVLTEVSQLVLELNAPPAEIYPHNNMLQRSLSNISGYEIRIQKISPHIDGDLATVQKTDVFIFGVDPLTKDLISAKKVRESLRRRHHKISSILPDKISMKGIRAPLPHTTGKFLKSAELAILVGALVVFLACISAIVCLCYRQKKTRRKPMPLPPGLNLNLAANGAVPILPLPYNGHYPAPYTHMSEHSDSSESTHALQQDPTRTHPMAEPMGPRQILTRAFNRVHPEIPPRNGRVAPVTHIDDDNWQWRLRQRHNSSGQVTEEEDCGHVHTCNHAYSSPAVQRASTRGSQWHLRENGSDADEQRGAAVRIPQAQASNANRQTSNGCCIGEGNLRGNENAETRPPSPDSLERNPSRANQPGGPPNHHRKPHNGRLASDVTEL